MAKSLASVLLCSLYAGCAATGWRQTAPHNTPFAWEYNAPLEGWRSLYAGWKQLTAPEGMIWDELTGSYQQDLGDPRTPRTTNFNSRVMQNTLSTEENTLSRQECSKELENPVRAVREERSAL